jgi:hypothetical protein
MLKNTYRDFLTYVKSKLKKAHKDAYVNGMIVQNVYLSKVNTVVIVGLTRRKMGQLREKLLAIKGIDYVAATPKTATIRRWDILTTDSKHKHIVAILEENLSKWLEVCTDPAEPPPDFPVPGIQTRTTRDNDDGSEDSDGGVSYLSSSAGSNANALSFFDRDEFREEPTNRILTDMSWAQVAGNRTQTGSTGSSQPTQSEISGLTNPALQATATKKYGDMEQRLNAKITDLTTQMDRLIANGIADAKRMQTFMATIQVNSTPSHQQQQQLHASAPAHNNHYGYNGTPNPPW